MSTIKSSREIDRIFRTATRIAHPLFVALVAKTPPGFGPDGRVAFVAGRKLGGAVWRNRCRRVLRESARRAGAPWAGFDVVLVARAETSTAAPEQLARAFSDLREKAGIG
jgi:ribonuclease P protein component